jgi:hypothetical protein
LTEDLAGSKASIKLLINNRATLLRRGGLARKSRSRELTTSQTVEPAHRRSSDARTGVSRRWPAWRPAAIIARTMCRINKIEGQATRTLSIIFD